MYPVCIQCCAITILEQCFVFFKDLAGICHDLFEWAISIFHFNQVVLSINGDISSFNFFGFLLLLKVTGQSNVLTFFWTAREW